MVSKKLAIDVLNAALATGADYAEIFYEDSHSYNLSIENGKVETFRMANPTSHAKNPAFDVTPAELITGIITEKGIVAPTELKKLF